MPIRVVLGEDNYIAREGISRVLERAEDIAPAVQRAIASGKPAVIHVEVDQMASSSFQGIPGFAEFRAWFGEEGDFLGVPGEAPAAPKAGGGSTENSSGY